MSVGIARAANGDVTPAGENFAANCEGLTDSAEPTWSGAFLLLAAKIQSHSVGTNKSLPFETNARAAAVLQKGDTRQNEDHGKVAKRMNQVARQEGTDYERHHRRDIGNACRSDGAKLLNDVIVNDASQTRPAQPKSSNQTYPSAPIVSKISGFLH
jgi:hypothetical protein